MIVVSIFLLGLMVSFVVLKGLLQARDYVAQELAKEQPNLEEKIED